MSTSLRIVPLGGHGEFGMNCLALEQDGDLFLVDCGVRFPFRELGVDVIHPDFGWVLAHRDRLRAVVLTHGHEDHIGALPYLLREIPSVPIYGPPHALALVRARIADAAPDLGPDTRDTEPGRSFEVGSFRVEPVRVTHSIPDATALIISTGAGTIVHTGDFNIDEDPLDGRHFDAERFAAAGRDGVRLLLSDSTNIDVPGDSGRERSVAAALERIVTPAQGRVVICMFASNLHRLGAIIDIARRTGRKLLFLGRSLHTHVSAGIESGHLPDPMALLVPEERAQTFPRRQLLVVATGTQGDPPSAMARLAHDQHHVLALEAGDTAVLSARTIPGNQQAVFGMINALLRRGVEVVHRVTDPEVHVSGHAARDEQQRMIELVRPRGFIPAHGSYHHMMRHAELARELGVGETLVADDGAIVEVGPERMTVAGRVPVGRVHVDAGTAVHDDVLRERALLGELGVAVAVVLVDGQGALVGVPQVLLRGVVAEADEADVARAAREHLLEELGGRQGSRADFDAERLEARAQRALRRYLLRSLGRKPLTQAVVVQAP